jgi:hypothetical protein
MWGRRTRGDASKARTDSRDGMLGIRIQQVVDPSLEDQEETHPDEDEAKDRREPMDRGR